MHAAAEDTGLPPESADLVSICLVMHELPQSATRTIVAEAFRLLRPGGTFSIMVSFPCYVFAFSRCVGR
jgi:ubiquinone/menaquinone biosynthesis C-methylase UbiE